MKDIFDKNCTVVFDLLPLYSDGSCSPKTNMLIRHHLAYCEKCRKFLHTIKPLSSAQVNDNIDYSVPDYSLLSQRLKKRRLIKNAALCVSAVCAVTFLSAYLCLSNELEENDNK